MDTVLFNGNLLTQDPASRGSAVALRDGTVAAIGDDRSIRGLAHAGTELIDLGGKTLVPGFDDAHAHIWKMGQLLTTSVDLRACTSFDDLGDLLGARRSSVADGAWLQARGFNEAMLHERRRPTRTDLDRWVPDRPLLMTRTCGHIFVANSPALRLAGITRQTPDPPGGVIEREGSGEANGLLHETAVGLIQRVLPAPTADAYEAMVVAALRHQAACGITASSDCGVLPELLAVYVDLDRRNALPGRMVVMPLGRPDGSSGPMVLPTRHRSPFLQVDTVKFLADGGLSGSTAALSVPYRHSASRGVLRFETAALRTLFEQARGDGWRIATHAIGDVSIKQVLELYAELGAPDSGPGHRIEHLGLPTATQLEKAAALGVMTATQSIFLRELGRNFVAALPDALLPQLYPFRSMLDAGVVVALSSDAPVVADDRPLAGMHASITRRTSDGVELSPEQALTATEALRAYTLGGAKLAGQDTLRGSITVGKVADLTLLSADPTAIESDALLDVTVQLTIVNGQIVYRHEGAHA